MLLSQLDLNINNFILSDTSDLENLIEIAATKFARHPSILAIKNNVATKEFHFTPIHRKT